MTGWTTDDPVIRSALVAAGLDSLEGVFAYSSGDDLIKDGLGHRRRTQLHLIDSAGRSHELYLKRYLREPLAWLVRRWLTYGPMKSPAAVEFDNIRRVRQAGVGTMAEVAFGQRGGQSYVIFTAVPGEAISRCLDGFAARHAADGAMERLAMQLGQVVGRLHGAGLAHRDLYAAHIFLNEGPGPDVELYIIDLARVFKPAWRKRRWFVKDMAQLKFSLPADWLAAYWQTLLGTYFHHMHCGGTRDSLARAIDRKIDSMRRRQRRRLCRPEGRA